VYDPNIDSNLASGRRQRLTLDAILNADIPTLRVAAELGRQGFAIGKLPMDVSAKPAGQTLEAESSAVKTYAVPFGKTETIVPILSLETGETGLLSGLHATEERFESSIQSNKRRTLKIGRNVCHTRHGSPALSEAPYLIETGDGFASLSICADALLKRGVVEDALIFTDAFQRAVLRACR
jgi:hypothetical protein